VSLVEILPWVLATRQQGADNQRNAETKHLPTLAVRLFGSSFEKVGLWPNVLPKGYFG